MSYTPLQLDNSDFKAILKRFDVKYYSGAPCM